MRHGRRKALGLSFGPQRKFLEQPDLISIHVPLLPDTKVREILDSQVLLNSCRSIASVFSKPSNKLFSSERHKLAEWMILLITRVRKCGASVRSHSHESVLQVESWIVDNFDSAALFKNEFCKASLSDPFVVVPCIRWIHK